MFFSVDLPIKKLISWFFDTIIKKNSPIVGNLKTRASGDESEDEYISSEAEEGSPLQSAPVSSGFSPQFDSIRMLFSFHSFDMTFEKVGRTIRCDLFENMIDPF